MIKRKEIACAACKKSNPMPPLRKCPACRKAYAQAHYSKHKEYYIEKKNTWKAANQKKVLKELKSYRERRGNSLKNEWRWKNPERARAINMRSAYKMRYGEFGESKQVLNELVRAITGNKKSFAKV